MTEKRNLQENNSNTAKTIQEFYQNLAKVLEINTDAYYQALITVNLPASQGSLLLALEPGEPRSMKSISNLMGCDASNITGLVKKLAEKGFVERNVCPVDRRIFHVSLTSKGISCREFLMKARSTPNKETATALTKEEWGEFKLLLQKLIDANHGGIEEDTIIIPPHLLPSSE